MPTPVGGDEDEDESRRTALALRSAATADAVPFSMCFNMGPPRLRPHRRFSLPTTRQIAADEPSDGRQRWAEDARPLRRGRKGRANDEGAARGERGRHGRDGRTEDAAAGADEPGRRRSQRGGDARFGRRLLFDALEDGDVDDRSGSDSGNEDAAAKAERPAAGNLIAACVASWTAGERRSVSRVLVAVVVVVAAAASPPRPNERRGRAAIRHLDDDLGPSRISQRPSQRSATSNAATQRAGRFACRRSPAHAKNKKTKPR